MPYPHGGCMLAACGVPTTYSGNGLCGIAFGENARYLESSAWEKGLILDASAARILSERGIDVFAGSAIFPKHNRTRNTSEKMLSESNLVISDILRQSLIHR